MAKKLLVSVLLIFVVLFGVFAGTNSKILIGEKYSDGNGKYIIPVLVSEDLKSYSITTYDASFMLTSVSGDGYYFKDGSTDSMSTTGTADTRYSYNKMTLVATSKQAAQTAFASLRYTLGTTNPKLIIEAIDYSLQDDDVFLNGHIYRLSPTVINYWTEAMNWCFNQGGYPVTITSMDENKVAFIFFKKLNEGHLSGYWSSGYSVIYLGVVPASYSTGSITVAKNASGIYQVSTTASVANAGRNNYKWMTGTPEAGQSVPTQYWCSGQPSDGGPVIYGHGWNGITSVNEAWDDWGCGAYTGYNTDFSPRACAEIEPDTVIATSNLNHTHNWVYTAEDNVLTATCSTGDCETVNTVRTITLTADNPTYEGTAFEKDSLFDDVEFDEFNISTRNDFDVSDINVTLDSDNSKALQTSLIDDDYTASITCGNATATLPVSIKHDHVWEYSTEGTTLVAKCTFSTRCKYNKSPVSVHLMSAMEGYVTMVINPASALDQSVAWTMGPSGIVTFNESTGLVKSVQSGETTLTVKAKDGSGVKDVAAVRVGYPVTGVTINKETTSINLGASETLTTEITPEIVFSKKIIWSSSDTAIASVDENGKVTGVGLGTATITALTADGCKTDTCTVTVTPIAVTEVKLDRSSLSVANGGTASLTVYVLPDNASNKAVTWSSSNTDVATVDSRGKITPKAAGTSTITVTSVDGSKSASCTLRVY